MPYAVVIYDRRGRGESGDTPRTRAVEDIAALLDPTGGRGTL